MPPTTCPDRQSLQHFLLGKTPETVSGPIERHLAECQSCAAAAETLVIGDDLTEALEQGARSRDQLSQADDEALAAAIQQAKGLASLLDTQAIGPDATAIVTDVKATDESADTLRIKHKLNFLAPAQQADELGRLDDYRVLKVLGVGGMGMVFKAEDIRLGRLVALKVMRPGVASKPQAKERFLREARATAAISHDHVVQIHQVGEDRGVPFIAMQYLAGQSLQTAFTRLKKLRPKDVARIGKEVALGLAAAHEKGLIHRDIKPDNIWIEAKTHRTKILDFGLARDLATDEGLTQSGTILGTPRYMAPEQVTGSKVDHRTDLFSLGSMLYHLASGKPAFAGENIAALLFSITQSAPQPVDQLAPQIDPSLADWIMRLLSKDPEHRPQSADEVAKRFAKIETALKAPVDTATVQLQPIVAAKSKGSQQRQPPTRRWPLVAAAGAAAIAIILGVIAITIRGSDGKETTIRVAQGTTTTLDLPPGSDVTIQEEAPESTASDFQSERIAAEWIRSIGGTGTCGVPGVFQAHAFSSEISLPSVDFFLLSVDVSKNQKISNDDLHRLAGCKRLESIKLYGTPITGGFWHLSEVSSLKRLDISDLPLASDEELAPIAKLSQLEHLAIAHNNTLTDKALEHIKNLKTLSSLYLLGYTNFTDNAVAQLIEGLPGLTELSIASPDNRRTLACVRDAKRLQKIYISGNQLTKSGVSHLKNLQHLSWIRLQSPISDENVASLGQFGNFDSVTILFNLDQSALVGGYSEFAQKTKVKSLKIEGKPLASPTNENLLSLTRINSLRDLTINFPIDGNHPRGYSSEWIESFRRQRPEVSLAVDGVLYPAETIQPGKGPNEVRNWQIGQSANDTTSREGVPNPESSLKTPPTSLIPAEGVSIEINDVEVETGDNIPTPPEPQAKADDAEAQKTEAPKQYAKAVRLNNETNKLEIVQRDYPPELERLKQDADFQKTFEYAETRYSTHERQRDVTTPPGFLIFGRVVSEDSSIDPRQIEAIFSVDANGHFVDFIPRPDTPIAFGLHAHHAIEVQPQGPPEPRAAAFAEDLGTITLLKVERRELATLKGRVQLQGSSGRPIAGVAEVTLNVIPHVDGDPDRPIGPRLARPGEPLTLRPSVAINGTFTAPGLSPAPTTYRVTATRHGFLPATEDVRLKPGTRNPIATLTLEESIPVIIETIRWTNEAYDLNQKNTAELFGGDRFTPDRKQFSAPLANGMGQMGGGLNSEMYYGIRRIHQHDRKLSFELTDQQGPVHTGCKDLGMGTLDDFSKINPRDRVDYEARDLELKHGHVYLVRSLVGVRLFDANQLNDHSKNMIRQYSHFTLARVTFPSAIGAR